MSEPNLCFNDDHIGYLIRQGKLKNYDKRGAPKVRRGDLPRKPPP